MSNDAQTKRWISIAKGIGRSLLFGLKWGSIVIVISAFVGAGAVFGYVSAVVKDEPVRTRDYIMQQMNQNIVTGFVYFNDDTLVGQLRSEEDSRPATLKDIPQKMIDATLSIEDANFYSHHGVDFNGIFRAVLQKLTRQDVQTGGSTITQQLARRVFLTLDRDIDRKIKEIFLSLRLERLMSKDEILLAYLNKIPYGDGATGYNLTGIKAAAKGIFNVDDLNQLNIAQCAFLAGIPQSPNKYSAFTSKGDLDPQGLAAALTRQKLVLKRMLEVNKITQQQYQDALAFDIKGSLAPTHAKAYTTYPYLMIEAEQQASELLLKAQYPNLVVDTPSKQAAYNEALQDVHTELLNGGYKIYTTIDKKIYDSMQEIAADKDNFSPDDPKKGMEQVGAVMLDNKTSAVLGMIEGRDFYKEQLNHATQAYRQPGSTMKPIAAYVPALESGAIQPASVIDDSPIVLKDGQKGFHIPQNWDTDFHGLITIRRAFDWSYNIPAIKLFLNTVGIDNAWAFAKKLGITSITKQDYQAQTGVIGGLTKGVSVLELTNAYEPMANQGVFNKAFMIRKIVDANGKTVYEHELQPTTVFSPETAYLITDMMRTVISEGTATDLKTKFKSYGTIPIVGKTGSTQDYADVWFEGYSPDITVGVWAGYEKPIYKLSRATGGYDRAKSVWALIMNAAVAEEPERFQTKSFEKPDDIVEMTVSNLSGKLPNELTRETGHLVTDIFNKNDIPTEEDDVMVKAKYVTVDGINYLPQPDTPPDMLREKVVIRRDPPISVVLDQVKAAMAQLPPDQQLPIDGFIPLDVGDEAPTATDPRTDDGKAPNPPGSPVMAQNDGSVKISFAASTSLDVAGYRLYRASGKTSEFARTGDVALTGDDTAITSKLPGNGVYGYYVVAVDIGGKESAPSRILYTDGSSGSVEAQQTGGNDAGAAPPPSPAASAAPGAPHAPSGLTLKAKGQALDLTWKAADPKDAVTQYQLYRSDKPGGPFFHFGTAPGASQEFLYYAGKYDGYYYITAVNAKGESSPSSVVHYGN